MSSTSITKSDGDVTITTTDDAEHAAIIAPPTQPAPPTLSREVGRSHFTVGVQSDSPIDGASFIAGLMLGALLYFILQSAMRWHARREIRSTKRAAAIGPQTDGRDQDGMAAAVAALARRTATLETIVTDSAQRTAREIEALR